jgi:uncharacterized membrane protein YgdD (TMEM256/DUF423 family)
MDKLWIGLGALAGLSAVAMAAAAAHLPLTPAALAALREGVQMQGWHALALLFTGMWAGRGGRLAHLAGLAFSVGLLLFCGAVYGLALGGVRLASVAPTGGVLLMTGWALLGISALRAR